VNFSLPNLELKATEPVSFLGKQELKAHLVINTNENAAPVFGY